MARSLSVQSYIALCLTAMVLSINADKPLGDPPINLQVLERRIRGEVRASVPELALKSNDSTFFIQ